MSYTNGLDKPTDYFNTITYTGNDTDGRTITGVGFQSDFSWVKARSSAFSHYIIDAIRYDSGASKYLKLDSSGNYADETPSGAGWISALNSDGYVCKNGTSNTNNCNENGVTYVAWNWLGANGTASNSNGSITSTVSANTTSGFSIVSYTGTGSTATIGHGLGSAPLITLIKQRSSGGTGSGAWNFITYQIDGSSDELTLNGTGAKADRSITAPTSSVFSVDTSDERNDNGQTYICYCFAEKKGYSKFGSYTGNGSTDGTFVYTGFKPAFVMFKITSSSDSWVIKDNKRDTINQMSKRIFPDLSNAEDTGSGGEMDFLSNGFKFRSGSTNLNNGSGQSYIYMAFAENPFVSSTGVPATAR